MAIRDIFKISRKTFFNPTAWFNYENFRNETATVVTVLRNLFTRVEPTRQETFKEAITRLRLSNEDVALIASNYRKYAWFFFFLAFLVFIYSFFILFRFWSIIGWFIGMGVMALLLSQAYQYDFWSLQMRKRRLGLTFADWQASIFGTKGKTHG